MPDAIENAFNAADQVMFEADLDEAKSPGMIPVLLSKALYADGSTLPDHVGSTTYGRLEDYLVDNHLNIPDLFRTWYFTDFIILTELSKAGFDSALGPDPFYLSKARAIGKPTLFLESVVFQFCILADGPEDEQLRALRQVMEDPSKIATETESLVSAWKTGDQAAVRRLLDSEKASEPAAFERTVNSRTRDWVPKIEALLKQPKTTLVIAGAAHMVGEFGLVNLLRGRGYSLDQLPQHATQAPLLSIQPGPKSGPKSVKIQLQVEPERSYLVEGTTNFSTWTAVRTFYATNSNSEISVSAQTPNLRFFRAKMK